MANNEGLTSSWKILQIGMVVKDMGQAVESLSAFGFGPFDTKELPPGGKLVSKSQPGRARVDLLRTMLGDIELELCQPVSGQSTHQEYLDSKGEGIHHVLFEVQDLNAELDRFTKHGAKVLLHITFDGGGLAYVDLNTCGFIVELVQLPPEYPD